MCGAEGPCEARPSRAVTSRAWTDRKPPLGNGGRRSRAAAPLQQRGRACVERKPRPDGTHVENPHNFLKSRNNCGTFITLNKRCRVR
jgi:hypothetical protein